MVKSFCFGNAEPVEQRQDHQRGDALRRRVRVVDRGFRQFDVQGFAHRRPVTGEILAGQRTADPLQVGRDLARDIAAVKIVETGMSELVKR